jgi:hypothetical protein
MRATLASMMFFASAGAASAATTATLLPTGDGFYKQWTPSAGATHYTLVDEAACNGVTDYNKTAILGQRDSYTVSLASVPNGSVITNIALTPCASRNTGGGGSATMNVFYRYSGTNSADAGAYALAGITPTGLATTNYAALAHLKSASSTLEVGAVYSAGTRGVRVSRLATVITYTALAAPISLDAVNVSPIQNNVSWTDVATTEDGYEIERSTNSLFGPFTRIATTTANTVSYSDVSVSANQTYYYRVRAYNAGGTSGYSNTDYAITASSTPNTPSLTGITATGTAAIVAWTDTATNEEGVKVERSLDAVSFVEVGTAGINSTSYVDSGLAAGTYYYRVRAYNTIGNSGYSTTTSVVIP